MHAPDLNQLVTLDALLQEGSVTRAARRLGLSTPAVSHALARLRERFADPLLVRAGRAMVLTPRAEALRDEVHEAVTRATRVFSPSAPFDPAALSHGFVVSASDYVLVVLGRALEAQLAARAPRLDLRFVANAVDDAERLRTGDSDLAIGIYGDLPPELKTRSLVTDRFVCVVRRDHPTVHARLTLERFVRLDHVQIAPRGRPGGYVDELLAERGLARRIWRAVPYFQVALAMVAASDAVLTVSERIARQQADALGLVVLEPPLPLEPFTLSLVWHPRFDGDPAHAWLRDQLDEAARTAAPARHPGARKRLSPSDPTTGHTPRRARASLRTP